MSLRDLSELSAPTPGLPTTSLVNTFGDDIDQAVTFHVNSLDGLYGSGECVVLFFEANKVPEVFVGEYGDIEEALLDYLDALLASEKPVDLPFTGRKVDRAELGVEVPEDLMQANVVSLESLRKVASLGLDCDLVLCDDEFWAFKYSTGSEYIEQIRRLERLSASGATHIVPLHAVVLDSYNHLRGFITSYQAGGSLVQFHKVGLQVAEVESADAVEPAAGSGFGLVQELGNGPQLPHQAPVWHDSTRLSWATQLAKVVAEIHRLDIVHGDIKPENVVIDKNGRLLIIDVYCEGYTDKFAAPEVLAHPNDAKYLSKQHDVYCVGMSIMAILEETSGLSPPTFPLTWNSDNRTPLSLRKLIIECLSPTPEARPPIDHIVYTLEHAETTAVTCNDTT